MQKKTLIGIPNTQIIAQRSNAVKVSVYKDIQACRSWMRKAQAAIESSDFIGTIEAVKKSAEIEKKLLKRFDGMDRIML